MRTIIVFLLFFTFSVAAKPHHHKHKKPQKIHHTITKKRSFEQAGVYDKLRRKRHKKIRKVMKAIFTFGISLLIHVIK